MTEMGMANKFHPRVNVTNSHGGTMFQKATTLREIDGVKKCSNAVPLAWNVVFQKGKTIFMLQRPTSIAKSFKSMGNFWKVDQGQDQGNYTGFAPEHFQ